MFEGIHNDPRTEPIVVDAAEQIPNPVPANPHPDVHLENE